MFWAIMGGIVILVIVFLGIVLFFTLLRHYDNDQQNRNGRN